MGHGVGIDYGDDDDGDDGDDDDSSITTCQALSLELHVHAFIQHSDPRGVGIITLIPNLQVTKVRLEGAKTFFQGDTAKEVMDPRS